MYINQQVIVNRIKETDRVLDVGGFGHVFPRANVVVDAQPYAKRLQSKPTEERFTAKDWIQGDFCNPNFWKQFKDHEFDFSVCAHVLEDVRDPLLICGELQRISKAGYIEFPSQWRECMRRNRLENSTGSDHHRWIVTIEDKCRLVFRGKFNSAQLFDYVGKEAAWLKKRPELEWTGFFWNQSFDYVERVMRPFESECEDLFRFYRDFDYANYNNLIDGTGVSEEAKKAGIPSYRIDHLEWWEDYRLPIEEQFSRKELNKKFRARMVMHYGTVGMILLFWIKKIFKKIDMVFLNDFVSRWIATRGQRFGRMIEL